MSPKIVSDPSTGILLRGADASIEAQARGHKLALVSSLKAGIPFKRALIVEAGTTIPWDLVDYGFHFVERWDAAAQLWRCGVLAKDIGTPAERKRTEAITRDLRVPVYACELLFVRGSPLARSLLECWQEERIAGDCRLAFLRALYQVKPVFCALPRGWLREAGQAAPSVPRITMASHRRKAGGELVHVELAPGRYVCCKPEDVEKTRAHFAQLAQKRHGR